MCLIIKHIAKEYSLLVQCFPWIDSHLATSQAETGLKSPNGGLPTEDWYVDVIN